MRLLPYLLLLLAVMFWSGNFIVSKWFVGGMQPYTLSFVRWLLAFLILLPFCWREIARHRTLWVKQWKLLLVLAVTGIISFNTLVNFSQYYTSPTNAALIEGSTPILSPFIAMLFIRERLSFRYYIGIVVALTGLVWIVTQGTFMLDAAPNIGDLLMLLGVVIWCVYSAITKKTAGRIPATAGFAVCIVVGLLVLLPFTMAEGEGLRVFHWTFTEFLLLLVSGCGSSVLAYLCWNKAVVTIGPSRSSLALTLMPVFTAIYAALFFHDTLNVNQMMGGALIFVGVFIAIFMGKRAARSSIADREAAAIE